jgi:type IV pilus assembly protein PilW
MSNYWGLVKGAGVISDQASQTAASAGAPTSCGTNFAHDLIVNIEGSNNSYGLACAASASGAVASSDTLTIRRAAVTTSSGTGSRLRICSTRTMGQLVTDTSGCSTAPIGQVNDLVVNTYYVNRDSLQSTTYPALRRYALVTGPAFQTDEVIPGVEDLQVQFGVDPSGTSGSAARYVNPDEINDGEQIVAVRLWLLVRAENPEVGFIDGTTYEYADRSAANGTTSNLNAAGAATQAYRPYDNFRRLLVSRTIQIRNALGT